MIDEYTEAEVQRALAEDLGVAEQGITVGRRENTLILCGEVESTHRRDEVLRLIHERFPGVDITADIGVIRAGAPTEVEELT
jgi:hypothetical protein